MKWHQILRKRLNYSKTEEGKPLCWDPAGPQELLRVLQRLCPPPRELSGSHTAQEARTAPWDPGRRDAGPGSQLPGEDRGAG